MIYERKDAMGPMLRSGTVVIIYCLVLQNSKNKKTSKKLDQYYNIEQHSHTATRYETTQSKKSSKNTQK
jgi:hypothetical protein